MRNEPSGTDPSRLSSSRRTFLGSLALLGWGTGVGSAREHRREREGRRGRDPGATLTAMTRNLYVGVDLTRLFRARSEADVRRIAGRMLEDVERRPFPPRAEAIADEVAATRPDVVGVQEAALVRTQDPSDFEVGDDPNASAVEIDFLEVLVDAFEARDLEYSVAASAVTSDVEVPADVDGRTVDVRMTDRDVLLVREGVEVGETRTGTYESNLEVAVDDAVVSIDRGYCVAAVSVDGLDATVATTHLESADALVRRRQAEELLDLLPSAGRLVLAADLNSGPGGSRGAYDRLTGSGENGDAGALADVHETLRPEADAPTCCQDADLRNDRSRLSRRIDAILARGLHPTAVERVGEDPDDRVAVEVDGTSTRLWPSDHAGVVATLDATPPGTAEETATAASGTTRPGTTPAGPATPAPAGSPAGSPGGRTTAPSMAGFGPAAAVLAVLLGAFARRLGGGS